MDPTTSTTAAKAQGKSIMDVRAPRAASTSTTMEAARTISPSRLERTFIKQVVQWMV